MQYMDFQSGYQQYMQWQGAGSSTGGAADYEQYMDYQSDYQQFLNTSGSWTIRTTLSFRTTTSSSWTTGTT